MKSISKKLSFSDRSVWTVGLTIEIKLHFKFILLSVDQARDKTVNKTDNKAFPMHGTTAKQNAQYITGTL